MPRSAYHYFKLHNRIPDYYLQILGLFYLIVFLYLYIYLLMGSDNPGIEELIIAGSLT